jgi:predicted flap endonuclease-1-like 5' DNA nuclease
LQKNIDAILEPLQHAIGREPSKILKSIYDKATTFDELTKFASDFVTAQKGLWDHTAWTDFLSNVRRRGFDVSEEMQSDLGELLEAMKRFYSAAASTECVEKAMRIVVNESVAFVKKHKGVWGHSDWEDFVNTVRQNTQVVSEGTTTYLGGVLESMKVFYSLTPLAVVRQSVSAAKKKVSPVRKPARAAEKKKETKPAAEKEPAQPKVTEKSAPKGADKLDDLMAIGGIGPALAKKLNAAGIRSYAQLAALGDKDIERIERDIIRFSGRIKRDNWVGQAKKLSQNR